MKSPFEKLRNIGLHKASPKGKWDQKFLVHTDGLTQAAKDMKDMRTCYDSLLSAAAATANSAYEFSESLLEMGNCLLEKTAMHDDGESRGVLSTLGKLQLELQKLVDSYRSHIIMTITNPSESLLSELRKVEVESLAIEMKLQCDEKRDMFEYMAGQLRENGRWKHGKGETFTSRQLQAVCEEYDDVARLCIFRVESLKQGQSRSLLTQAARHHAAQLHFFRKGLQSLEAVEPRVRNVAEKHRIDYELSDLNVENMKDEWNSFESNGYGEISFDFRKNELELDKCFTLRNSVELDQLCTSGAQKTKIQAAEGQISSKEKQGDDMLSQRCQASSYSAPIYKEKFDLGERIKEMLCAMPKVNNNTHVLPTPCDAKASALSGTTTPSSRSPKNTWHSSPLDTKKQNKFINHHLLDPCVSENPKTYKHFLPLPTEGADERDTNWRIKRQSFSDSLASRPSSNHNRLHINASPPISSSPKINELHELPRPPDSCGLKLSVEALGHSAPLGNRNRLASEGSPLPLPHHTVSTTFSIRSSGQREVASPSGKLLQSAQVVQNMQITSPPLSPLFLSNLRSPNRGGKLNNALVPLGFSA
ncbi:hydroxyproline-rich glycoprotein family protein [Striga asiatica]|uniref:Hydroxyproline-rich glycoprotein family protein n=1 Tax=Striga asiatica TaxID=4170 RepID=A0A5A7Q269_STRAF|nr:hydroxyproline-rich glycoprotein family protein [Striga asiatica]